MRNQTNYGKLVARKDNEYYFCDYIFDDTLHDKPFRGATGTIIIPVSKGYYKQAMTKAAIMERLEDCGIPNRTKMYNDMKAAGELEEFCFDMSNMSYWEQLRDKFPEKDYPVMECIGGGRIFHKGEKYDEVFDAELLAKIEAIES